MSDDFEKDFKRRMKERHKITNAIIPHEVKPTTGLQEISGINDLFVQSIDSRKKKRRRLGVVEQDENENRQVAEWFGATTAQLVDERTMYYDQGGWH